jgi:hypothetical protein
MSNWGGRTRAWLCAAAAVVGLGACAKTVEWQEEVPLNTGETIWVRRSVEYERAGEAGNPFQRVWRTRRGSAVLAFEWRGKPYRFSEHGGPMVLAIGREGRPAVIAQAEAGGWDAVNQYRCTLPFYVQFVPDESGTRWTWPPSVDPSFYHLETNLLLAIPKPDDARQRFTAAERSAIHRAALASSPARQKVDPGYGGDKCRTKGKGN